MKVQSEAVVHVRNIRRVAVIGTAAAVTTAAVTTSAAAASAAASQEAAARAAAAKPPPVNVQIAEKPAAPPPGSPTTQKLEQLKSLLSEGLIAQAQYQKASQQVLNQLVQ
jgi:hypothetical protein